MENSKKIVIIEDDAFLGKLLIDHFKKSTFDVHLAIDGESGLEKIKELHPDLVLLDILLPGIDGYEVLKRIKSDASISAIPTVILSNLGQKEEIEKGKALGATDFMIKAQLDLDEITAKAEAILGAK